MGANRLFTMTLDHIMLLRHAHVWWFDAEYGAPCIDPKRPYGNGNVALDIAHILKWRLMECPECGEVLTEDQRERARLTHREMETALQLFLLGHESPGTYEEVAFRSWRLLPEGGGDE